MVTGSTVAAFGDLHDIAFGPFWVGAEATSQGVSVWNDGTPLPPP